MKVFMQRKVKWIATILFSCFIFAALSANAWASVKDPFQPKTLILSPEVLQSESAKEKAGKNVKKTELKDITTDVKYKPVKELKPKLELIVKPQTNTTRKTAKNVLTKPEGKIKKPVAKAAVITPKKLPQKEIVVKKDAEQKTVTKNNETQAEVKKTPAIEKETETVSDGEEKSSVIVLSEALPESDAAKETSETKSAIKENTKGDGTDSKTQLKEQTSLKDAVSLGDAPPKITTIATETTLTPPSTLAFIPAEEKREVQIVVGESKIISAIGLIRAAVGNPAVADVVVVSNHELLINGKNPGTTTLTLWDKRGRLTYIVTVLREPLSTKTRVFPLQYMWLKKYDVKTGDGKVTWTVSTNATLMGEIDKTLSLGISKDSYSINTELNNIVVQGTEKDIQKADMIISSLDIPPQQILIETRVLEVTDDVAKSMGFTWNMNKEKVAIQYDTSGGQFKIDTLGALTEQYIAKVNALQEDGKANLLANPKIAAVLHRDPGLVFLGDSIPVVTTTKDSTGASLQSVTYVEVGVNLFFLPTSISADGYVTMFVHSVSTSVSGFTSAGYPMFKGKSIRSELRIKDGEAVVMGGLLRSDETEVLQKVPYLSELPFLGNFFKNKTKTKKNSEMIVIFIPHILKNAETIPAPSMTPIGKN